MESGKKHSRQSQKFIDKAREIGADEDEAAFADKLRQLAKQKPKRGKAGKQAE